MGTVQRTIRLAACRTRLARCERRAVAAAQIWCALSVRAGWVRRCNSIYSRGPLMDWKDAALRASFGDLEGMPKRKSDFHQDGSEILLGNGIQEKRMLFRAITVKPPGRFAAAPLVLFF